MLGLGITFLFGLGLIIGNFFANKKNYDKGFEEGENKGYGEGYMEGLYDAENK